MKKILGILIVFIAIFTFNLNVNAANDKIDISEVKVIDKSSTITVDEPTIENNAINSSVKFNKVDDFVIYEVSLKNTDKYDYTIDKVLDNNTSDYLSVEYEYSDELKKNNSGTLKIKLTYKKQVLNQDKVSLDDLLITVNLIRSDGSKSSIKVTNPTTGDSIVRYVIIFILAISGLILTIKKVKVKNIKVGMFVLALPLVMLPFSIFALEKFEIKISFSNSIELIGEYEVYDIQIGDTTRQVTYGQPIGQLPEIPEKNGYEAAGWVDSDGNEITEDTIVTKPLTLTPKYTVKNYPITFNLGTNGTTTNDSTYTVEDEVVLTEPTRDGYVFTGWTGFNGNTPEKSVTIPKGTTGPIELTANWKNEIEYTVTYNPGEGQVTIESEKVSAETAIDSFPTPTLDGYEFIGWYNGNDKVEVPYTPTSDIELVAHYNELPNLIQYSDKNNNDIVDLGDYVKIGNDGFYVIGTEDDNVKLLAEYNLDSDSRQTSGYFKRVGYAEHPYWTNVNEKCQEFVEASGGETITTKECEKEISEPTDDYKKNELYYYVYRDKNNNDTDNHLFQYVNNYRDYLRELGAKIEDVRIMSYEEAVETGCSRNSYSCPRYIANQYHWLGSVEGSYYSDGQVKVWLVNKEYRGVGYEGSEWNYVSGSGDTGIGVRPLVIISKNDMLRSYEYYSQIIFKNVEFDTLGGSEVESKNVIKDSSLGTLPKNPTKEGYMFEGWYTDSNYNNKVDKNTLISDDVTFVAKWIPLQNKGVYKYADMDENNQINYGDYLSIDNEEFWVISSSNGEIKLLTKFNLKIDNYNISTIRQGTLNDFSKFGFETYDHDLYYNGISELEENYLKSSYGTYYIYRKKNGDALESNSLKAAVDAYSEKLADKGVTELVDARVMSYEEAANLGCSVQASSCPELISDQDYWLGSYGFTEDSIYDEDKCYGRLYGHCGIEYKWYIRQNNHRLGNANDDYYIGLRPLIIINESALTN